MHRRPVAGTALLLLTGLLLPSAGAGLPESPAAAPPAPGMPGEVLAPAADDAVATGLATVFRPGDILQDRNGDDHVDFVAARVVIPEAATPWDVAASTAVAARLGLETSGLDFPLVFRDSEEAAGDALAEIVIGADNDRLPAAIRDRVEALEPGHGVVALTAAGVAIAGVDGVGTRAAAEAFAARSPYLWEVIGRDQGDTFDRVAADVGGILAGAGLSVASVSIDELVYGERREEAAEATVSVTLESGEVEAAARILEDVAARHRRGRDTDRLSYASAARIHYRLADGAAEATVTLPRVGVPGDVLNPPRERPTRFERPRAGGGRGGPPQGRTFDLVQLLDPGDGLLQDRDGDGIPDDSDTMIVFPAAATDGGAATGTARLGARLGLESTGLTFPLLGFDDELEDPEAESRPLVIVGRDNELGRQLRSIGKLREAPPDPGVGRVEMVPDAWHANSAVVVSGGDRDGEEAAATWLSRRAPHLWTIGRGEDTLADAEDRVRKLLAGRTTAGQAALAADAVDRILDDLDVEGLESLQVEAFFEEGDAAVDAWLQERIAARLPDVGVEVTSRARMDPVEVFRQEPELEWEVDAFRQVLEEQVLPAVGDGSRATVELRVSEAPELRVELETEIREALEAAGAGEVDVVVLSAYKQGLSWLTDRVAPALEAVEAAAVEIGWKPFPVDPTTDERFQNEPARWLNELYPADDVLSDRLGLPLDAFSFFLREEGEEIYTLTARDGAGAVILEDSFSPRFYERPYLDAFPEYATVTVATGWVTATVDGETVVDERLRTDSDRIWDHFQGETLSAVLEHVRGSTGNRPTADKAPYFHTLRIELQASEPDYRLGIDEEHVSALESLHDDFYFDTLDFFYQVAESASDGELPSRSLAAGNVLPWIHPERRGEAPGLTVTYSAFASKEPKVVVTVTREGEEEPEEIEGSLEPVEIPEPYLYLAEVEAGADELRRLGLLFTFEDDEPLPRLATLLDNLAALQEAGLAGDALALRGVVDVAIRLEAPGASSVRTFPSRPAPRPEPETIDWNGERLVTWDHVISPDESERIVHTLGTTPNVTSYVAGESYQGRPVSVMEIHLPMEAELVSQAKLNAWKPVLSIVGRQHANEVSSTSHILRLAELLATDPDYQRYLQGMNLVIQPVVNPDGAALAFELQKLTPTHCLHAGRYSALGPDVPGQANNPDTLLTEALVMRDVRRRWVADVSLNPHGYPSHEWVHQFANYNPKSFRSYWIPRGWYTSVRPPEDPRLEDYRSVDEAMMDYIAEEVSRDPLARETNLRIYDRYDRWAIRWQPHLYSLDIHRDTAIYHQRRSGRVAEFDVRDLADPTAFSGGTEAMDETSQGAWHELVTQMGFGYLMASVRFLDEADVSLYLLEGEGGGRVRRALLRPRPVVPAEAAGGAGDSSG